MFRYVAIVFFAFIVCVNAANIRAEENSSPEFFSVLQDVPLMDGMEELTEHALSFDKPEGRISESIALMHMVTKEQVLDFYKEALPQFGWGLVSQGQFFRKGELLEIFFENDNGDNLVKITIKPSL